MLKDFGRIIDEMKKFAYLLGVFPSNFVLSSTLLVSIKNTAGIYHLIALLGHNFSAAIHFFQYNQNH